jgi:hypothetical protein
MTEQTKVTIGETFGKQKVGNLTIENAKFWGRPNLSGEMDRFKDDSRKFTVIIPNEAADDLRALGWNVKTRLPDPEFPDQEPISSLKVKADFRPDPQNPSDITREKGPDVWIIMGENREKLNSRTVGLLDRSRVEQLDLEVRGWEYDPDENPGALSARLVALVAVIRPNILEQKYGRL